MKNYVDRIRIQLRSAGLFLYYILERFPLTKRYLIRITYLMEHIKPSDREQVKIEAIKLIVVSWFISAIVLLYCVCLFGGNLYYDISVVSLVYILNNQLIHNKLEKEEYKLLKQLEKYLGDVRHYYHSSGMVEEAVYDSLEDAPTEIEHHMALIYDILCSDEPEESEKYREIAPNKFFTTFLALCQITMLYGDTVTEETSLFLSNLNHLRNEIYVELLKREKIKYVFSGLIFVTIFPVFFLKAIEKWSISNLPELEKYYYGGYGILILITIFLATLFSYQLVSRLKENQKAFRKNHKWLEAVSNWNPVSRFLQYYIFHFPAKTHRLDGLLRRTGEGITVRQFLVRKYGCFLFSFLATLLVFGNVVAVSKQMTLSYTKDFKGISMVNQDAQIEEYRSIIKELTKQYKKETDTTKLEGILGRQLNTQYGIENEYNQNALTSEIIRRIREYQSYGYRISYLVIACLVTLCTSNMPLIILECRRYFMNRGMEDEVIQFHSILIMLMHIKRMNVETILEWMENFSEIFQASIMECVDQYAYDNETALKRLKEQEPFMPFVRIVENLEACDRVGIEKAFDEIASQRTYFAEKRKQDNEINISNKGAIGKVVAYIPLSLTVALYLIIPFVLESIAQLMGYLEQIQGI